MPSDSKYSLSIIIPCFNGAQTVENCLESTLKQNSRDIEIIVVDDASSDETPNILQKYIQKGIRVLRHDTNSGVSTSRNDGIDASQGEYITFLDADDQLDSNFSEKMLSLANLHNADIVACNGKRFLPDGSWKRFMQGDQFFVINGKEYSHTLKAIPFFDSSCCKLYRKTLLDKNRIRFLSDMKFGEDTLFANHAAVSSGEIVVCNDYCGYLYNYNANSCIHTIEANSRLDNLEKLIYRLAKLFPNESEKGALLRKCQEYVWTIKKFGGKDKKQLLNEMLASSLWTEILLPVIQRFGKFKHRAILQTLRLGCHWTLHFW